MTSRRLLDDVGTEVLLRCYGKDASNSEIASVYRVVDCALGEAERQAPERAIGLLLTNAGSAFTERYLQDTRFHHAINLLVGVIVAGCFGHEVSSQERDARNQALATVMADFTFSDSGGIG